jgi:hypothetical protein
VVVAEPLELVGDLLVGGDPLGPHPRDELVARVPIWRTWIRFFLGLDLVSRFLRSSVLPIAEFILVESSLAGGGGVFRVPGGRVFLNPSGCSGRGFLGRPRGRGSGENTSTSQSGDAASAKLGCARAR